MWPTQPHAKSPSLRIALDEALGWLRIPYRGAVLYARAARRQREGPARRVRRIARRQPLWAEGIMAMPLPQLSLHQTPDAMVNVPSCVPPERPKPIVMLHVSHTGGTFLCNQAKANCEAVWPDSLRAPVKTLDCNEPGMYGKVEAYLNCTTRRRLLARAGVTFSALERGFETGEFCPDDFDYIAMLRDPVDLIQSLLGSIGVAAEAVVEAIRARNASHIKMLRERFIPQRNPTVLGLDDWPRPAMTADPSIGHGMLMVDNPFVRHLAASTGVLHAPIGSLDASALAMAKRNLERFKLTLPLDTMRSAGLMSAAVAMPPMRWQSVFKVPQNHHPHQDFNATERAFFAQINALDLALIAFGEELFWRRLRGAERDGLLAQNISKVQKEWDPLPSGVKACQNGRLGSCGGRDAKLVNVLAMARRNNVSRMHGAARIMPRQGKGSSPEVNESRPADPLGLTLFGPDALPSSTVQRRPHQAPEPLWLSVD